MADDPSPRASGTITRLKNFVTAIFASRPDARDCRPSCHPAIATAHIVVNGTDPALRGSIARGSLQGLSLVAENSFNARWDEVRAMGFDDRFRRMWNFYLTSCAGAFEGGNCDVTQITVTRPV